MRTTVLFIAFAACVALAAGIAIRHARNTEPVETQAAAANEEDANQASSPHWQVVEKWLQSAGPRRRASLRMQIVRPGIILPPDAETYPRAPDDLRIVITRNGNEPAVINVRHGEKKWTVTENELDQLPSTVRLHVQRPLGWVLTGPAARAELSKLVTPTPGPSETLASGSIERLERRLDEMNARVEALLKAMEKGERNPASTD
jgi:hypothetical protein